MLEQIDISSIITNVFCFAITGLITYEIGHIRALHKQQDADRRYKHEHDELIDHSLQALSRQILITEHDRLMAQGYATYQAKSTWLNLYKYYEKLGVNGVMEQYRDDLLRLPSKEVQGGQNKLETTQTKPSDSVRSR